MAVLASLAGLPVKRMTRFHTASVRTTMKTMNRRRSRAITVKPRTVLRSSYILPSLISFWRQFTTPRPAQVGRQYLPEGLTRPNCSSGAS